MPSLVEKYWVFSAISLTSLGYSFFSYLKLVTSSIDPFCFLLKINLPSSLLNVVNAPFTSTPHVSYDSLLGVKLFLFGPFLIKTDSDVGVFTTLFGGGSSTRVDSSLLRLFTFGLVGYCSLRSMLISSLDRNKSFICHLMPILVSSSSVPIKSNFF